jgi:hypothetical protein
MMMVTVVIVGIGMMTIIVVVVRVMMIRVVAIPASDINMRMGRHGWMRRGSGRVGRKWRMRWFLSYARKAKP